MDFISSKNLRPLLKSIIESIVELHIGHRLVDNFLVLTPNETSAEDIRQLFLQNPQLGGVLTGKSILSLSKWVAQSSQEIDYKAKIAPSYIQETLLKSLIHQDLTTHYSELSYKSILLLIQSFREEFLNATSLKNFLEGFDPLLAQYCHDWFKNYEQAIDQHTHLKDFTWQAELCFREIYQKKLKALRPIRRIYYLGFLDFPPLLKKISQSLEKYYPEISQVVLCQIPETLDPQDYLSKTWEENLKNLNHFEDKTENRLLLEEYSSPFEEASALLLEISNKIKAGVDPDTLALTLPASEFWHHYYQKQFEALRLFPHFPSNKKLSQCLILEELFNLSPPQALEKTEALLTQKRKTLTSSPFPSLSEELKALEAFRETLEEILFYQEEYPWLKPHLPSLRQIAQQNFLPLKKPAHGGIQIRRLDQVGLKQFSYNFVPQLTEEAFPKNPERFFGLTLPNYSRQLSHQQALYQDLLYSAPEVKITYSKVGTQAREQSPSSFIIGNFSTGLSNLFWGAPLLPPSFSQRLAIERLRQEDISYQHAYGGQIKNKKTLEKLQNWVTHSFFSASRLEKYATCPFSFFASTLLRLETEEEKNLEGDAREQGKWIHHLLENFFKQNRALLKNAGLNRGLRKEIEEKIKEEIHQATKTFLKDKPWVHPKLFEDFAERALKTCHDLFEHFWKQWEDKRSTVFIPEFFEYSFGKNAPLAFQRPGLPPLRLKGQIDRIDVSEDRKEFITWDYKTGAVEGLTREIKEFKKLQLPLYLMAAQKIESLQTSRGVASLALGLKEMNDNQGVAQKERASVLGFKGRPGCLLPEKAWEEFWPLFEEKILDYFEKIYRGDFRTQPEPCSEYCEYRTICRYHEKMR